MFPGLYVDEDLAMSKRRYNPCAELSDYDCTRHLMGGWIRLMMRQRSLP